MRMAEFQNPGHHPGADSHVAMLLHQLSTLGSQGHGDQEAHTLRSLPVPETYVDMKTMVYRAIQKHADHLDTLNDEWQAAMHRAVDIEGEVRRERQRYEELITAWENVARDRNDL